MTDKDEARAQLIEAAAKIAHEKLAPDASKQFDIFLRNYYAGVPFEDIGDRKPDDVYGAALAHWDLGRSRASGEPKVRVYTPQFEQHGWQTTHTVVEIVNDDMPFLVDSVRNEISRHDLGIHIVLHPIMWLRRDDSGGLTELIDSKAEGTGSESFIHFEIDRMTQSELLDELQDDLLRILGDVRAAVEDWGHIRERVDVILADLEGRGPPVDEEELTEAKALLSWIADDHFTFLGYREYDLADKGGEDVLEEVEGSGLGILRSKPGRPSTVNLAKLPREIGERAHERNLLILTKANSRATVHRRSRLDYVGIKRFDEQGNVSGERRFLGLYTSVAYNTSPTEIPVLRHKYRQVVDRAGFALKTHSRKDLETVLESFPRDELFQSSVDELYDAAVGVMHLQERQRLRLFVRRDGYGRFFSCLVYLPRDRYNTESRRQIQRILTKSLGGVDVEYSTQVSESILARLHYIIYTEPTGTIRYDADALEVKLTAAIRTWNDELEDALLDELGEERGLELLHEYGDAFPAGYRAVTAPRRAVADIEHLEALEPEGEISTSLYRQLEAPPTSFRFTLYTSGERIMLSDLLPRLENMGVQVAEEHPYEVRAAGETKWIFDLGLTYGDTDLLQKETVKNLFQETFARVWDGLVEDDGFNRLVLRARLGWRDIAVLRAYSKYLRQTGSLFSQTYVEETLVNNPAIARQLIDLFHARFEPARAAEGDERLAGAIERALDDVASLDEDRILRSYLALIRATLRTNFYQRGSNGKSKNRLVFKFDPEKVPALPLPRPTFEIFVYSPRTEGVHLRGGKVARGGVRWSDRREDFRTEILGLMKAQQVKNAVIVPVGAKGGFVVKRPPPEGDRDALFAEVESCYRTFIRGLLDVTDNLVDGAVEPPEDTVRYDDDDTYLVVAADKGTATFSDTANEISAEYGFWLGDAFASGGSAGYDHKEMGITARGAWESVNRHFRELGTDIQSSDFTAIGIGDMSGDVFGNGALLSRHMKLIAALDHRHIFIDPDPDPESSFAERDRMFRAPRSSWDDYDRDVLSEGGGVYPRDAKSIKLSPQAKKALGTEADKLTPNDVVSAILRAPVALFFNGGIGTFVKASEESHADVGDRTNDAVRVDASELRCHVVGEGGNLGFTQRARIEFALAGGRIYTDSIDNSAGVDCSDHEVNIKILLDSVVRAGDMNTKQRNSLLKEMTNEVGDLVLKDNYEQARALANSMGQAASMASVYERYVASLEQGGKIKRRLEFLPDAEAFAERRSDRRGLCSPEFAVLLSYTKLILEDQLVDSDVPEDPYLAQELERYFPQRLRERFGEQMQSHPLRRQIVATQVANELVNSEGTTFVFRLAEETGAPPQEIARAYAISREVLRSRETREEIEALGSDIPASTQTGMILEMRKLAERVTRWLLGHCSTPLDISKMVEAYRPGCEALSSGIGDLLLGHDKDHFEKKCASLEGDGVPAELARKVAGLPAMSSAPDLVQVARATEGTVEECASIHFLLGDELHLGWLRDQILSLPRTGRWQTLARDALRSDLQSWHSALSVEVVSSTPGDASPKKRLSSWLEEKGQNLARYRSLLGDLRAADTSDLATMSVALREVRTLAGRGSRPPVIDR